MHGTNDHPDQAVNQAITAPCVALVKWERATGRQSALILRENNGEYPSQSMIEPGYVFRAVNGLPLGSENDDLTDAHVLRPFVFQS